MTATNTLFSNGLIEISAITTLFGASTAASLALGDKAAAGLPWASISTFGAIHVARANLSAAVPDWVRAPLGLDGAEVKAAVGKLRDIKESRYIPSEEVTEISAIGMLRFSPFLRRKVTDERFEGDILPSSRNTGRRNGQKPVLIYSLDATYRAFERIIPKSHHKTLRIHRAQPKGLVSMGGPPRHKHDWIILLASSIKVAEMIVLWYLGAGSLWWSSSVAWLASFIGALVLQGLHLSRDDFSVARSNILLGQMPTALRQGGEGHIILGASGNVRRHWAWRIVWLVNTIAVLFSLLSVFLELSAVPPKTVHIWLAFQFFFMLVRVIVHNFTPSTSSTPFLLPPESWGESSTLAKRQALQLLMALAQYQTTIHPRGARAYELSLTCFESISSKLASCGWRLTNTLYLPQSTSPFAGANETIHFVDVIPDTVLSTISWTLDRECVELYDSAIVFTGTMAIPCIRAYTCFCEELPESATNRGMAHECSLFKWIFWIPYRTRQGGEEGYLNILTDNTRESINTFERIDHQTLHARLEKKVEYNLSITHGDEIKKILEYAREMAQKMVEMFKDAQEIR